jgi:anaerobic ribonucleoside-triphosphate reductase
MLQVRKRDGRYETYQEQKIINSIMLAAKVSGKDDFYNAPQIARAITQYLEKYYNQSTIDTKQIRFLVYKTLNETGNMDVANAYNLKHSSKFSTPTLFKTPPTQFHSHLTLNFPADVFEKEKDIDACKLSEIISSSTLKQYMLKEVLPPDVSEAHMDGRIHIHSIEHPTRFYSVSCNHQAVKPEYTRAGGSFLRDCLFFATLRKYFCESIQINNLHDFCKEHRDVCYLMDGIYLIEDNAKPRLIMCVDLDKNEKFATSAIEYWLETENYVPKVFSISEKTFEQSSRVLKLAVNFVLHNHDVKFIKENSQFLLAQVISINLPRICYVSKLDENTFFTALDNLIKIVAHAHHCKARLIERIKNPKVQELLAQVWNKKAFAVAFCGLYETLKLLGYDPVRNIHQAINLLLRIVSLAYFRTKEESQKNRIKICLEDIDNKTASEQFCEMDKQIFSIAREIPSYTPGLHIGQEVPYLDRLLIDSRLKVLIPSITFRIPAEKFSEKNVIPFLRYSIIDSDINQVQFTPYE